MKQKFCEDKSDLGKVYYGEKFKRYDTQAMPMRQCGLFTGLMALVSRFALIGKKYKIEKINMEGLKPPYILLSNHMYFVDFELAAIATFPHKLYNITTIDGYYRRPEIMELLGCICKRKFTSDPTLVRAANKVLHEYKGVLCMYPEARYSPIGTTAILPDSMGKLIKAAGNIPVVVMLHHGNYLMTPFWNYRKPRKVPLYTTLEKVLSGEDVEKMTAEEIQEVVTKAMQYDEYKWQKEQNIIIDEPFRAEGLEKVLYKCPGCLREGKMEGKGAVLRCRKCGTSWEMSELGELIPKGYCKGFSHIPDWYEWQREEVRKEIESGEYYFEDEVEVYSLPNVRRFEYLGKAEFTHSVKDGFSVEGEYNGQPYHIRRGSLGTYGIHVEYDYCYVKPEDCIDISTADDSLYCYPAKRNVVTKLSLATEEIYKLKKSARKKKVRVEKDKTEGAEQNA